MSTRRRGQRGQGKGGAACRVWGGTDVEAARLAAGAGMQLPPSACGGGGGNGAGGGDGGAAAAAAAAAGGQAAEMQAV